MTEPLKLGLAGIGTVGTGLVQLIAARADALVAKTGRPIEKKCHLLNFAIR